MVALGEIILDQPAAANPSARRDRCVEKQTSVTTDYLWLGWQTMEERNPFGGSGSTDTPIGQYVWGQYIDECIQLTTLAVLGPQSLPAGAYYLFQDLLYRGVALTNSSGAIVEAYDTDAYGNTIVFTGPGSDGVWFTDDDVRSACGANEIIYCGYRFDPETELYYVRNRTYNPALGRWLQRDPIGYRGAINLYEYVGGRAASFTDAAGLQIESPGYYPPAPPINPAAGEAAEALLAALAAAADVSWLPWVAFAALVAAVAFGAWEIRCRDLYDEYKADCGLADALHGCRPAMPCSAYPPRIAAWYACASGRQVVVKK